MKNRIKIKTIMEQDLQFIRNTRRSTMNTKKGVIDIAEYFHDLRRCHEEKIVR